VTELHHENFVTENLHFATPSKPSTTIFTGGRPAASLLIFNATWDAADECPGGNYPRYESFCNSIWDKVSKGGVLVLTSPSLNKKRAADGITIGRDICEYCSNDDTNDDDKDDNIKTSNSFADI